MAYIAEYFDSTLCNLCVLCVSVVDLTQDPVTTETQRTQRLHRVESKYSPMYSVFQDCYIEIDEQSNSPSAHAKIG